MKKKIYKITRKKYNYQLDSTRITEYENTLEELNKMFSYTLNGKKTKTIQSFLNIMNNTSEGTHASSTYYLKED